MAGTVYQIWLYAQIICNPQVIAHQIHVNEYKFLSFDILHYDHTIESVLEMLFENLSFYSKLINHAKLHFFFNGNANTFKITLCL